MASGLLGRLSVVITADTRQFQRALEQGTKGVKGLEKATMMLSETISSRLIGVMAAASVGLAQLSTSAGRMGAEFEEAMTVLIAIQGAVGDTSLTMKEQEAVIQANTKALGDFARSLGKETVFTATEAAQAMQQFARAGLKTEEMLLATQDALHFAHANATNMTSATTLLAATMSQFSMGADESRRIVDTFTAAMQNSLLDVESLTVAMRYAGSVASNLGMDVEQTASAISLFRDMGLEGSTAGTQFRQAMLALENPTRKARKVLEKYNLAVQDVSVKIHGFEKVMETLGEANMTLGEMTTLVSKRASGSVSKIAMEMEATRRVNKKMMDEFGQPGPANKFVAMMKKIEDAQKDLGDGASLTEKTYKISTDNVKSQFKILGSVIQETALTIFDSMKKSLMDFALFSQHVFEGINDTLGILSMTMQATFESVTGALGEANLWKETNEDAQGLAHTIGVELGAGLVTALRIITEVFNKVMENKDTILGFLKAVIASLAFIIGKQMAVFIFNMLKQLQAGVISLTAKVNALTAAWVVNFRAANAGALSFVGFWRQFVGWIDLGILRLRILWLDVQAFWTRTTAGGILSITKIRAAALATIQSIKAGLISMKAMAAEAVLAMMAIAAVVSIFVAIYNWMDEIHSKAKEIKRLADVATQGSARGARRGERAVIERAHGDIVKVGVDDFAVDLEKYSEGLDNLERNISRLAHEQKKADDVLSASSGRAAGALGAELDALRQLSMEQVRAKLISGELVKTTIEGEEALLSGAAAALLLATNVEGLAAAEEQAAATQKALRDGINDEINLARNLSTEIKQLQAGTRNAELTLNEKRIRSLRGVLKLTDEQIQAKADEVGVIQVLTEAEAILQGKITAVQDARRNLNSSMDKGVTLSERERFNLEMAALNAEQKRKAMEGVAGATDDYAKSLSKALSELEKFEAKLRKSAAKKTESEQSEAARQRLVKLQELHEKVKDLQKRNTTEEIEALQRHNESVQHIEAIGARKLNDRMVSLENKMRKERGKIYANQITDLKDVEAERLKIVSNFQTDQISVLELAFGTRQSLLDKQKKAEIKRVKESIANEEERNKVLIQIEKDYELEDRKLTEEYRDKTAKANARASKARTEIAEITAAELLKIEEDAEAAILALKISSQMARYKIAVDELAREKEARERAFRDRVRGLENEAELIAKFERASARKAEKDIQKLKEGLGITESKLGRIARILAILGGSTAFAKFVKQLFSGQKAASGLLENMDNLPEGLGELTRRDKIQMFAQGLEDAGDAAGRLGFAMEAAKDAGLGFKDIVPLMRQLRNDADFTIRNFGKIPEIRAKLRDRGVSKGREKQRRKLIEGLDKPSIGDRFKGAFSSLGNIGEWDWSSVGASIVGMFKQIGGSFAAMGQKIWGGLQKLGGGFIGLFEGITLAGIKTAALTAATGGLVAGLAGALVGVVGFIVVLKKMKTVFTDLVVPAIEKTIQALAFLTGGLDITNPLQVITSAVNELVSSQSDLVEKQEELDELFKQGAITTAEYHEALQQIASTDISGNVASVISEVIEEAKLFATMLAKAAPDILREFAEQLPTLLDEVAKAAPAVVSALMEFYPQILAAIFTKLPELINDVVAVISSKGAAFASGIASLIASSLPSIITALGNLASSVVPVLVQSVSGLVGSFSSLAKPIIESGKKLIFELFKAAPSIIASAFSASTTFLTIISDLIISGITALNKNLPKIIDAITDGLPEFAGKFMASMVTIITMLVLTFINTLALLVMNSGDLLAALVKVVAFFIAEFVRQLPQLAILLAETMVNAIIAGLKLALDIFSGGLITLFEGLIELIKDALSFDWGNREGADWGEASSGERSTFGEGVRNLADRISFWNDTPGVMRVGRQTAFQGFASGDYFAAAQTPGGLLSQVLGMGGEGFIPPSPGQNQPIDIAIMAEGRLLDAVQVRALDRGNAPRMEKRLQRQSGVNVGFNRGRFSNYGAG